MLGEIKRRHTDWLQKLFQTVKLYDYYKRTIAIETKNSHIVPLKGYLHCSNQCKQILVYS